MPKLPVKVVVILAASIVVTLFIHFTETETEKQLAEGNRGVAQVEESKRSLSFAKTIEVEPYKEGKNIVYSELTNCSQPGFIENLVNPCWQTEIDGSPLVCAARIMLLGFHKSGTSDLTTRFGQHKKVFSITGDYFWSGSGLSSKCPMQWIEEYPRQQQVGNKKKSRKIAYNDCPGCVLVSKVIQENATFIIRRSAIQYLQYTMVDQSRYIIIMRDPADRMISHFFYVHKVKRGDNPYSNMTIEDLGDSFFHNIVSESVEALMKCLQAFGTTVCVLESGLSPIDPPNHYVRSMIIIGCYSTHLKEVFKFIPKERIYFSKLEDYSKDETESMKKIYSFVGLPIPVSRGRPAENKPVRNAGYGSKPVLAETRSLLKEFYAPFNMELSAQLNDKKWLWT